MPAPASRLPERVETILLDAGGVLLQLDYAYLRRLVRAQHVETREADLARAETQAREEINRLVIDGARPGETWRDYFHLILARVGVPGPVQDGIIDSLWEAHLRSGLWTVATDGGPATLAELKRRGYRLGVVSNAEGHVARDLESADYRGLFETVVDSAVVGVEKPDPAIFRLALTKMGADAATTIFVGDVPSVDVSGARAARIEPILLDPFDLYADWRVARLKSLAELPEFLAGAGRTP